MGCGANARRGAGGLSLLLLIMTAFVGCWAPLCAALKAQELLSLQVRD